MKNLKEISKIAMVQTSKNNTIVISNKQIVSPPGTYEPST